MKWPFPFLSSLLYSVSNVHAFTTPLRNHEGIPVQPQALSATVSPSRCELCNRRDFNQAVLSFPVVTGLSLTHVDRALAADETSRLSPSDILLRLRSIPTFCLVNEEGIPFMIFDGQASATGYFFLSFQVAAQALEDARKKDKAEGASEVWSKAKILVVPLAVAIQLTLRKTEREAVNNGLKFSTYNDIVPSAEGVEDAKRLDSKSNNPAKWEQKGRVPLFYIEGMTLPDGREPRYFNRADLVREWFSQNPGSGATVPPVQVVEFVDLYRMALGTNSLKKISNLAIMPVQESNQLASKLIQSEGSTLPKYDFNKVFLVGSASS